MLERAGLRPRKSFSQSFLVAPGIAQAVALACVPGEQRGRARVIEIGAGTGALTRLVAPRAAKLWAIERDRDLIALLRGEVEGTGAVVVEANAVAIDFASLLGEKDPSSERVVCGNLPYAITGRILRRAAEQAGAFDRAVLMVQDEVSDRMTAPPGHAARGALSVFVQAAFAVRRVLRVPPEAFYPRPAVRSALLELRCLRPARAIETPRFQSLVRAAFHARRKKLRNAWSGAAPDASALEQAARGAQISLDARGETLDVEAFGRMADEIERLNALR